MDSTPVLNNLVTQKLAAVEGTEVVVSYVSLPPNTKLPKHFHPGEEFAYVTEGSFTLMQEGEEEITYKAGDVGVVPYKKVHSIKTGDEDTSMIVFRVHKEGEPERILVD